MSTDAPAVSPASPSPALRLDLRIRLSVMMFLEFAIWGAWAVVFTQYLGKLGFTASDAGQIIGTMALGAIISPSLVGQLADRYISSEKLMAILHLGGAGLLYWMAHIQEAPADYYSLYAVTLLYALVYNPTLALANSITFTHAPAEVHGRSFLPIIGVTIWIIASLVALKTFTYEEDRAMFITAAVSFGLSLIGLMLCVRDFPSIRVLGTVGWIIAGIFIDSFLNPQTNEPLLLAAGLSAVLGILSLLLPKTPPKGQAGDLFPFVRALKLLKEPSFAVFFGISFVITIVLAFYYSFTYPYLVDQTKPMVEDVPQALAFFLKKPDPVTGEPVIAAASMMTIGQIVEMILLPLLPWFLYRLGMKWVLVLGMLAWGIRYYLFSLGGPFGYLLLGVALHGICFDFFFAAGFIHIDNTAPKDIRASGQALFAALTYGLGMWLGSILSGVLLDFYTVKAADAVTGQMKEVVNWNTYWTIPSLGVFAATAVFVLFFRMRAKQPADGS